MNWLLILNIVAGASLLVHAACVINNMSWATNHLLRAGYVLLGAAAFGVVLGPVYGYTQPQTAEVLLNVGSAFALIVGNWLRHGGTISSAWRALRVWLAISKGKS